MKRAIKKRSKQRKIYLRGRIHPKIRVPMRLINAKPPVYLYDTSGPYGGGGENVSLGKGIAPRRSDWISRSPDI